MLTTHETLALPVSLRALPSCLAPRQWCVRVPDGTSPQEIEQAWRTLSEEHELLRLTVHAPPEHTPFLRLHREMPVRLDRHQGNPDHLMRSLRQEADFAVPGSRLAWITHQQTHFLAWTYPALLADDLTAARLLAAALYPAARHQHAVPSVAQLLEMLTHEPAPSGPAAQPLPLPTAADGVEGAASARRELPASLPASIRSAAEAGGFPAHTYWVAAAALLTGRYCGEEHVVLDLTEPVPGKTGAEPGAARHTSLNVRLLPEQKVSAWLQHVHAARQAAQPALPAQRASLTLELLDVGEPLRQSRAVAWRALTTPQVLRVRLQPHPTSPQLVLDYDRARCTPTAADRFLEQLEYTLRWLVEHPDERLGLNEVTGPVEAALLKSWNATQAPYDETCIHSLVEAQARRTPDAPAITCGADTISYGDLDARAERWATRLIDAGVRADVRVGICMSRSIDMVVAILGVLKAGGAYLPLDPDFPAERLDYMLADSAAPVVVTNRAHAGALRSGAARKMLFDGPQDDPAAVATGIRDSARSDQLAYVIYTSGSTGQPKGVMVEHRNVANFLQAMDAHLAPAAGGRWLAVTSLSFDISVLELLWTLTRGFEVIMYREYRASQGAARTALNFSLSYFASDEGNGAGAERYRLLLEGAKFADRHGFHAVWTPERHFHAFGGLYPNPSVISAALAATTQQIRIRAGSVVLPLHHPLRVAEDWALVDNLSNGRVGVSFASGWQANDFSLAPERYAKRHESLYTDLQTVRRAWRGEELEVINGVGEPVRVSTRPRPVQQELPVWITAAGSPETFRLAGEAGAGVLTHLLGQSVDEVREKVRVYREAFAAAGHTGRGTVTLMLHTFVGDDEQRVRELVREPLKRYLRTSMNLIRDAAASFPAFAKRGEARPTDFRNLSEDELDALLEHAFNRYYQTSGLFGTPERCLGMLERVQDADVDEVACLIDFGVAEDAVLAALETLRELKDLHASPRALPQQGVAELVAAHRVTHIQCTPSRARMLLAEPQALHGVTHLVVGGEALPVPLAHELLGKLDGTLVNMYGPTETTVWSLAHTVRPGEGSVPIGRPILNTDVYVVNDRMRPQPIGATGELLIGGAGVTRGYLGRPDLTNDRFVPHPYQPQARVYRTGDLARFREDGTLEFLGRRDHQVKVRGYRVELGEIEAALVAQPDVHEAAVVARENAHDQTELHAYVTIRPTSHFDEASLKSSLSQILPAYMLPTRVWRLQGMPLTPNGKIDRRALPVRPQEALPVHPASALTGTNDQGPDDVSARLKSLWCSLLGLDEVSSRENFFDLGGHSLLAVTLLGHLREQYDETLQLTDIFRYPSIDALARRLRGQHQEPTEEGGSRARRRAAMLAARQATGSSNLDGKEA